MYYLKFGLAVYIEKVILLKSFFEDNLFTDFLECNDLASSIFIVTFIFFLIQVFIRTVLQLLKEYSWKFRLSNIDSWTRLVNNFVHSFGVKLLNWFFDNFSCDIRMFFRCNLKNRVCSETNCPTNIVFYTQNTTHTRSKVIFLIPHIKFAIDICGFCSNFQ